MFAPPDQPQIHRVFFLGQKLARILPTLDEAKAAASIYAAKVRFPPNLQNEHVRFGLAAVIDCSVTNGGFVRIAGLKTLRAYHLDPPQNLAGRGSHILWVRQ